MLKIGETYTRTDPQGRKTEVFIKNRGEQQYHQDLESSGYTYEVVTYSNVCTACEG